MEKAATIGIVPTCVVSGAARGVDTLGEAWARAHDVPIKRFPVTSMDWQQYGRGAGHRRNRQMAEWVVANGGGALVALWADGSPGTKNMIETAKELGLRCFVRRLHTIVQQGPEEGHRPC